MRVWRIAPIVAMLGAVAGCTSDIEQVRTVKPTGGTTFTQALADEYKQLAVFETDQNFDWASGDYFAGKGLQAAKGEVVPPEELARWNVPTADAEELSAARARLISWLDAGARDSDPERAARAQVRFDCWVENANDEAHQPHMSACRDEFEGALPPG
jgi:OOP family OmpA-OmpF porin